MRPVRTPVQGGLRFVFPELPETFEDFSELTELWSLNDARNTAAMFVLALARYTESEADGLRMLNCLRGPRPLSHSEVIFLHNCIGERWLGTMYFDQPFTGSRDLPAVLRVYDDPMTPPAGFCYAQIAVGGSGGRRRIVTREAGGRQYLWDCADALLADI